MGGSDSQTREERQAALKGIIRDLHAGVPAEKLKRTFAGLIRQVSPEEIAEMENALIQEGFPIEDVQRLCDVHAQVFDRALKKAGKPGRIPGHPIHTYVQENKEARGLLRELKRAAKPLAKGTPSDRDVERFSGVFGRFREIEKHYARKENQLFPALEAKSFTGPTKVMWGKHDEIRSQLRSLAAAFEARDYTTAAGAVKPLAGAVKRLIFLEEKILFPTSARKLNTVEWARIKKGEPEIGYAWVKPSNLWDAQLAEASAAMKDTAPPPRPGIPAPVAKEATYPFSRGDLTPEQADLILKALPLDITYVDESDRVRYYSDTAERVFPRSPEVIGRAVQNCHPHQSVHIVDAIVRAFRDKRRDMAEFWIRRDGRFLFIRYFPVHDANGTYRGVIEVTQDATGIRALEGERRLLDW